MNETKEEDWLRKESWTGKLELYSFFLFLLNEVNMWANPTLICSSLIFVCTISHLNHICGSFYLAGLVWFGFFKTEKQMETQI